MATTNFIDGTTTVVSSWLNDVDAHAYNQTAGAHSAANISFAPTGSIAATNTQAAIAEVATEAAAALAAVTATTVPFTPAGTIAATNVQAAIVEVAAESVQKTSGTGSARLPVGTTAQRDAVPVAGMTRWNSTIAKVEYYDSTRVDWIPTSGSLKSAVITCTGSFVDIPNVPAWATRIEFTHVGVSSSSVDSPILQYGTTAGPIATGYTSYSTVTTGVALSVISYTLGVMMYAGVATRACTGTLLLRKVGDVWVASGTSAVAPDSVTINTGSVTITDPVTYLRVRCGGAASLDAGTVQATFYLE